MNWFPWFALAVSLGVLWWTISEGRKQRQVMASLDETYKILALTADQEGWEVKKTDTTITVTVTKTNCGLCGGLQEVEDVLTNTVPCPACNAERSCVICQRELTPGEVPPYCADCEMGH